MSPLRLIINLFFCSCIAVSASAQLTYQTIRIEYDSGWTYKNLSLIPIRIKDIGTPIFSFPSKVISLKEAMQKGKVKLKEFYYQNDATVRILAVENNSDDYVLIQDGELLSGGKQDRIIAESKILYPHDNNQFLDVFCIEQYRWDKKSKPFKFAGDADAGLRKIMDVSNQQQFIWREIEQRLTISGQGGNTRAYLQSGKDSLQRDTAYISFFNQKMKTSDSLFAGFIAITDTNIISCDVFASTSLFMASYKSMVQGWVYGVLQNGGKPKVPYKKLKEFTDKLFTNEDEQRTFLQKHGKAFLCDRKVFHIVAHN